MHWLALLVILSAATYRVGRLWLLDEFTSPVRDRVFFRLDSSPRPLSAWLRKLLGCPWCITVWIAGGIVASVDIFTSTVVPLPLFTFLAVAAGSLVFWGILDSDE